MPVENERFDATLACAWIRGLSLRTGEPELPRALLDTPLHALMEADTEALLSAGRKAQLKLYRFKDHRELPRVKRVLGILSGLQPESLLDVGSGRGVFLFPFLRQFPGVPVTSLDLLPHRVEVLSDISTGGYPHLTALRQDITEWDMPDDSFDVVTLLEVLEHIPDVGAAIAAAVRLAKRCVIVTVPSKPDDNPEHIHLLTKPILTELFAQAGCTNLHFDGVNGHLLMTAWL